MPEALQVEVEVALLDTRDAAETQAGTKALPDPINMLADRNNMLSVRTVSVWWILSP